MDAILQLLDQVFLMATVVGREDDLLGFAQPIVADVKEVTDLVEEPQLTLFLRYILADHDHAIVPRAGGGTIIEFGHIFVLQPQRLVAALTNNLVLDVVGALPWGGHRFVLGWTLEFLPAALGQSSGLVLEIVLGVVAENEANACVVVPAVQVFGLREIGVAAEQDGAEATAQARSDGTVEGVGGAFVAGAIAGPIDDPQDFTRVGQADDQRMIAPRAVVGDVHALLAFAGGCDQTAVSVDLGLGEEVRRLLAP